MIFTAKDIAQSILGTSGRSISGCPTLYREAHPAHIIMYNIILCTENEKLWFGDIDVTRELILLRKVSNEVKQDIYMMKYFRPRAFYDSRPDLTGYLLRIPYLKFSPTAIEEVLFK